MNKCFTPCVFRSTRTKVYKKDIFGDTVVEDEGGGVIGKYKKDFHGNLVFEAS